MKKITFVSSTHEEEDGKEEKVTITFDAHENDTWFKQANMFFRFLEAQGYVIGHEMEFSRVEIVERASL